MSDAEEAMEPQKNESSPDRGGAKLSAAGEILAGKRTKKTVERLDFQAPKQKEKLKTGEGSGEKLGDIPRTNYQITKMKPADLKTLHSILFDRPGQSATIKKTLRLFNGFGFDEQSEQFSKKREKLLKSSNLTNSKLKVVCSLLDLEKKGTHSDLVDRILTYLVAPKNSGKRLPVKKKKKSKKKLSGDDSTTKTKKKSSKPKPSSSSSSPKKSKSGSKSKAIVMDSSSDDEDDDEDEKTEAAAEAEGSEGEEKTSDKDLDQSEKSERSSEDDSEDDEEESPKTKPGKKAAAKMSTPVKRAKTPAKKAAPPKKRAKKDESDGSSDADQKPKKKPAAKTKKADSSSGKNTNTAADDSSDDEPLINMVKKSPTDEQLKDTVKSLLEDADLEEMTMKQICQRVFDTFPNQDLSAKKDFIKQTVKSLIT